MRARRLILPLLVVAPLGSLHDGAGVPPAHRALWLPAGDVRVRAVQAGDHGPSVLILHGYGESLVSWQGVVDALSRDHRVTAIDLPGFGLSDKPDGPYDLPSYVARITPLLAALPPPRVIVGHSMGGAIATAIALEHPDLLERLVLLAPAGDSVGLAGLATDVTAAEARAIGAWESARAWALPVHAPNWLDDGDRRDYAPSTDPAYRHATGQVVLQFDFTALNGRHRELHLPVLVLTGAWDPVIPLAVSERIRDELPCGRLVTWPRVLHRLHASHPTEVADTIAAFLAAPGDC